MDFCISGNGTDLSRIYNLGTSLVVQWLRLCAPNAGSIPGQVTRADMPQLGVYMPQVKIPHATAKTQCSHIH